jgi:hypothetical protein
MLERPNNTNFNKYNKDLTDAVTPMLKKAFKTDYTAMQKEIIAKRIETYNVTEKQFEEVLKELSIKSNHTPAVYEIINLLPKNIKEEETKDYSEENRKTIKELVRFERFNDSQKEKLENACMELKMKPFRNLSTIDKVGIYKILQHNICLDKLKCLRTPKEPLFMSLGRYAVKYNIII